MFHTYFTYVSHEFTCLGCRCRLPISLVFVPRQIWDLALMPWHLWGWWSTASGGACWTLRGGDANRDGHGWPWRLMQIGESNLGLPEDLAKSVEHSDRWVCYSLFMSGFVVLLFPVCFWRLLELPSVPACPRAGRSNCMHVPWQVRSSNMDQPLSTLYASIWMHLECMLIRFSLVCDVCVGVWRHVMLLQWSEVKMSFGKPMAESQKAGCFATCKNHIKLIKPSKTKPHGDWYASGRY